MKRAPEEELLITNRMRKVPKKRSKKVLKVQITSPPFDGSSSLRWKKCQMRFSCWMPRPKKERKKILMEVENRSLAVSRTRTVPTMRWLRRFPDISFLAFWSKNLRYPILTLLNIYRGQLTVFLHLWQLTLMRFRWTELEIYFFVVHWYWLHRLEILYLRWTPAWHTPTSAGAYLIMSNHL